MHACLDVWEGEPEINRELGMACYLATPHIAGYSYDGKVAGTQMLHQALCQHFSLQCVPPPTSLNGQMHIPKSELMSAQSVIGACIAYAYSIREDDAGLRDLFTRARGASELAEGFDSLRKNYPKRREFSCYSFSRAGLPLREQASLEKIGFMPE